MLWCSDFRQAYNLGLLLLYIIYTDEMLVFFIDDSIFALTKDLLFQNSKHQHILTNLIDRQPLWIIFIINNQFKIPTGGPAEQYNLMENI